MDMPLFYPPEIGLKEIDFNLVFASDWRDDDLYTYYKKKSIKCAEILIPHSIPYGFVVCAAVCNEEAQTKLKNSGFDRRIFVEPDFFF